MRVKVYDNNIVHLMFPNRKELALTLCRPQEFYESNNVKLRNRIFTFEQFIDQHIEKDGNIYYFNFWSGFNIPGHILEDFFEAFELTNREMLLRKVTKKLKRKPYYVIGTLSDDKSTIDHELLHAHYYLNPVYKQQVDVLVRTMRKELKVQMIASLKNLGYASNVMIDEINAYMGSSSHKYLVNELDLNVNKADIKPFADLAKTVIAGLV